MIRRLSRAFSFRFSSILDSHTQELSDELYVRKYDKTKYYQFEHKDVIDGYATVEGTQSYSKNKNSNEVHSDSFKVHYNNDLQISTLGIGTYLGAPDATDDSKMFGSIIDSIQSGGVNHIDTAINYRYMKSERTVGAALRYLFQSKAITREQIFIASKSGYVPADGDRGILEEQLIQRLVENKIITNDDVVGGCHSMTPGYLQHQLDQSLSHLGLKTLDLLYLHNASESQLPLLGREQFMDRLAKAFEFLELKVQEGVIKHYGMATWVCFRALPTEEGLYLSLQEVVELAKRVGGSNHHFNYVQVPINLMMPEAFAQKWQQMTVNGVVEDIEFLAAARNLGINVISSSPLMNGALMQIPLPSEKFLCQNLGAKHLQFVRSIPSEALKCTLIGQKRNRHTKMNLEVVQHRALTPEEFWSSLKPQKRKQNPEDEIEVD